MDAESIEVLTQYIVMTESRGTKHFITRSNIRCITVEERLKGGVNLIIESVNGKVSEFHSAKHEPSSIMSLIQEAL